MDTLLGMYHAIRTVHGCYIAKVKNKNLSKKYEEQVPSKQKPLTAKKVYWLHYDAFCLL